MENTPKVHNVIVCTLCSCYPKMLLGIPPAWYKSLAYRSRTVVDPRGVLAEFGVELPEGVEVRVHDSTADLRYIVLPMRPKGTRDWSEEQLAALVTRDSMIGTAIPAAPAQTGSGQEKESGVSRGPSGALASRLDFDCRAAASWACSRSFGRSNFHSSSMSCISWPPAP